MKEPCSNCPFRSDRPFGALSVERAEEIAIALHQDSTFHCHKTTGSDEEGRGVITKNSKLCTGAAIFLENTRPGGMLANLGFRLGFMRGEIKPAQLSDRVPVYQTAEEFIDGASRQLSPRWIKQNSPGAEGS